MRRIYIILSMVFMGMSSCMESSERSRALLNVFLVDAPGDYDQVWIELLGVEVEVSGTRGQDNADPIFLPYTANDKQVNLSNLIAGTQLLVGRGEFLVGNVTKLTLKLGSNNYVVRDQEKIPLVFESPENSEPSVDWTFNLTASISHDIFLDFDVNRSVIKEGDIYTLRPILRPFTKINTGDIEGSIRPQGLNAVLYAIRNQDTLTSTAVDTTRSGQFLLRGLSEGNNNILIQPKNRDYKDTVISALSQPGEVTRLGNITLVKK